MVKKCIIKRRKMLLMIIKLVYRYEKLIGLCPLSLDENDIFRFSIVGTIYSIILCFSYSFIYIRAMFIRITTLLPMETVLAAIIATLVISLQYIVIIVAWLIFAFRQKRILKIFENFQRIEEIGRKLDIKTEIWENIWTLCMRIIFVNVIFGGLLFLEIFVYSHSSEFEWIIWIPCDFPHIIIHNLFTLFISALDVLKGRFHKLNIHMSNLPVIFQERNLYSNRSRAEKISQRFSNSMPLILECLSKLHDELKGLSEITTDFLAPIILLAFILSFLQIVLNLYLLILYLTKDKFYEKTDLIVTINSSLWASVIFLELFFTIIASGTICDEANNTGNAFFKLWVHHKPQNCKKSIIKISLQLLQEKFIVSLFGLLIIDYSCLYRICGAVTTYLLIMLQMGD